jgi:hypothetical protein
MDKEDVLVLDGWSRVRSGLALAGDKHWSPKHAAWLPVTVNQHTKVEDYAAVIRKNVR